MNIISALISGLLFGIGLIVAGMANPAKVLGFLDIFGAWDPSLAFVMAGGLAVSAAAYWLWARKRTRSVLNQPISLPTTREITPRLLIGSAIFGIGWGIAGICPGPALVLLGSGLWQGSLFVIAMCVGMLLQNFVQSRCPFSNRCGQSLKK